MRTGVLAVFAAMIAVLVLPGTANAAPIPAQHTTTTHYSNCSGTPISITLRETRRLASTIENVSLSYRIVGMARVTNLSTGQQVTLPENYTETHNWGAPGIRITGQAVLDIWSLSSWRLDYYFGHVIIGIHVYSAGGTGDTQRDICAELGAPFTGTQARP